MHFLSLSSAGCFSGTNGPNRFVSQYNFSESLSRKVKQRFFNLLLHYIKVLACFALFQYFANAEDGQQIVGQCRSEEHTSELQSRPHLVCRLLLEKTKT